jgi:acyl carrier protein
MDRKRILDEVIEILANKLHQLPPLPTSPEDADDFDYEGQKLVPDITSNHLDIAEVSMDLEDAFGVNFEESLPGSEGLETIGQVVDFIAGKINSTRATAGKE